MYPKLVPEGARRKHWKIETFDALADALASTLVEAAAKDEKPYVLGDFQYGDTCGSPKCNGLHRRAKNLTSRWAVTLDADSIDIPFDDFIAKLPVGAFWYTTASHTPARPRVRVVLPLANPVSPSEYSRVSAQFADDIGLLYFDRASFQPIQCMYQPVAGFQASDPADVRLFETHPALQREISRLYELRAEILELEDGETAFSTGGGWEDYAFHVAGWVARAVGQEAFGRDEEWARRVYDELVPSVIRDALPEEKLDARRFEYGRENPLPAPVAAARVVEVPKKLYQKKLAKVASESIDAMNVAGEWFTYSEKHGRWLHREPTNAVSDALESVVEGVLTQAVSEEDVKKAHQMLASVCSAPFISGVLKFLKDYVFVPTFPEPTGDLVPLRSGMLDPATGQLLPHGPEYFVLEHLPVEYDPQHPDTDKVRDLVYGLFGSPDVASAVLARFAQGLVGRPPRDQKLLVMMGSGANGKSLLLTMMQALFGGAAATSSGSILTNRPEGQHMRVMLEGARVSLIEEFPDGPALDESALKAIVGQQTMTINPKYEKSRNIPVTWVPVVTTNTLPDINATNDGVSRRLLYVTFPYKFVEDPILPHEKFVDYDLMYDAADGKFSTPLLNVLLEHLDKPITTNALADESSELFRESNPMATWADTCLAVDGGAVVKGSDLYQAFIAWSAEVGEPPIPLKRFYKRLEPVLPAGASLGKDRTNTKVVRGVQLRGGDFD